MDTLASRDEFLARATVPVTESDDARVQALLEDATTVILSYLGRDALPNPPRAVRLVCLSMALRVYQNPLGITSETVGDTSMRRSAASVAGMTLTDSEKTMVDKAMRRSPLRSHRIDSGITDEDRAFWGARVAADRRYYQ
ncbi:phage head-tail connector protein [Kitasatospora purpeofusca]|uniref:phage head-tail connector protein n=1 Tax=Kitasatospora purpeofusca TaxID=67352 RepID=UPI0036EE960D